MPKFTTPYDTLLRVRRIEEDKAKAVLAAANHAHREAQAAVTARQERVAGLPGPDPEMDLGAFRSHVAHTVAAVDAVGWAAARAEKTGEARAAAVETTRQASMRTQGLGRLVERAKEARVQEMLAADQRTAEESMAGTRGRTASPSTAASADPDRPDERATSSRTSAPTRRKGVR